MKNDDSFKLTADDLDVIMAYRNVNTMKAIIDNVTAFIPQWANWIAVNKNGDVCAYECEPCHGNDFRWYGVGQYRRIAVLKNTADNWSKMKYRVNQGC